jgi:hypothetical protein
VTFTPGSTITKREVWDGAVWLEHPVVVESDDGDDGVLAVVLADGAPFTFPPHPGGPHPWSGQDAWGEATVLQLRRPDEWYSVWKFFSAVGEFECWYINFERPVVRTPHGIDTDDLELDLVVLSDGERHWKDVEHLAGRLDQRRFGLDELVAELRAAAVVSDLLDRDDRWWAPWDEWAPGSATMEP